jgi:glycosyltransferase involved in cell wall biosynthesis
VYQYWMPFFAPAFGTIARRVKRLCRPRGVRTIMVVHNLLPHERRPFDRALTRYVMGATDAYIVQSGTVRVDLVRLAPKARFLEVPHPVYNVFGDPIPKAEARASLGLPAEAPLLLFFGLVRRYKGLDTLLRALPAIRAALDPSPRLLVVGEFYEGREETAALVRELGLGEAVTIVDEYVADEKVGQYFSAADVVVLPYKSATQSGIVQIAYQLERPVICTDVGGLAEVVRDGETGFVVPPDNPRALADAVIRYQRDACEAGFMERIRGEKHKYSWDRMAKAIETLAGE